MSLKNCKRCGSLFSFQEHNVCQQCLGKDEADFQKIWEYMREHPGVSVLVLSRETGVEPAVITRFLREGRLASEEMDEDSGGKVCESCGVPIFQGRYCQKCVVKLRSELTQAAKDIRNRAEVKIPGKVHSLDSIYKRR
ncbi:MAG TPA: MerR family transcriptional regulator [Firmicutes bacterium]|nr:MerR family transcriptional regulator [Bacillota bacterium]HBT18194.1 MerR family transcriptional regulator [Bacillota bacterium]